LSSILAVTNFATTDERFLWMAGEKC